MYNYTFVQHNYTLYQEQRFLVLNLVLHIFMGYTLNFAMCKKTPRVQLDPIHRITES